MHKTPANIWWREQIYAFPSNFSHFEQQQIARVLTALSERAPLCISRIYRCEFYVAPPLLFIHDFDIFRLSIEMFVEVRERRRGEKYQQPWLDCEIINFSTVFSNSSHSPLIHQCPTWLSPPVVLSFRPPPPLSLVSPRSTSLSLCPSLSRSLAGYPALRSIPTQFIPKYNTVSIRSIY